MDIQGKLPIGTRFFKVLIPGYEKSLRLPLLICMMLNGEVPERATLVTRQGSWNIGVGQSSSKNGLSLTLEGNGWDSFIQHHYLSVGDFVFLEHTGNMYFDTLVFDSTTCEKEFPTTVENAKEKVSDDNVAKRIKRETDEVTASHQHKNASFQLTIHGYNVKRRSPFVFIPAAFLKTTDLSDKKAVTLINPSGNAWKVELDCRNKSGRHPGRPVMTKGWDKFMKANKLNVGNVCEFKLKYTVERNTNLVMDFQVCSR